MVRGPFAGLPPISEICWARLEKTLRGNAVGVEVEDRQEEAGVDGWLQLDLGTK